MDELVYFLGGQDVFEDEGEIAHDHGEGEVSQIPGFGVRFVPFTLGVACPTDDALMDLTCHFFVLLVFGGLIELSVGHGGKAISKDVIGFN